MGTEVKSEREIFIQNWNYRNSDGCSKKLCKDKFLQQQTCRNRIVVSPNDVYSNSWNLGQRLGYMAKKKIKDTDRIDLEMGRLPWINGLCVLAQCNSKGSCERQKQNQGQRKT